MAKNEKENKEKRYYLPVRRLVLIFIALFVVFEVIFYLSFQGANGVFYPFDLSFYIYTPILFGTAVLFCVMSATQVYYKIDAHRIIHVKRNTEYQYFFKDIIYVDEKWSEKHKMLLFYDRNGKAHYLNFDRNAVIYEKVLDKANLMSREEFQARFPKVKL